MSASPAFIPCAPGPTPHLVQPSLAQRLSCLIAEKIVHPVGLWRFRRALRSELIQLDHRELHDLGIAEEGVDGFVATWTPRRAR
ncbi:conserved hypothetical protein [Candidatus Terasakiella magnetica]|nr:conserved hypothetical protein [Candidatus Terasakiella magnetica]